MTVDTAVKTVRDYCGGLPLLEALETVQMDMREDWVPMDVQQSYIYLVARFREFFAPAEQEA